MSEEQILGFDNDSWITSVSYNKETKALTVNTERGSYELASVELETYEEFKNSSSRGAYFNRNLKSQYINKFFG